MTTAHPNPDGKSLPVISARHVNFAFGEGELQKQVLFDVCFEVAYGEIVLLTGPSGSGKTIILIHRALRLAQENPTAHVRVFTINRSLAELLRESIRAIHGCVPPNLHVDAFYDFLSAALRGEGGAGMTCDFLQKDTVLAIRAVDGLDKGARLRFVRRGDERGEVTLAALQPGGIAKVRLPNDVCTGVKTSKVELQLLAPGSSAVSARMGPYGLRC